MAVFRRITVLDWSRPDDRWRTIEVIHKKSRRKSEEVRIGLDAAHRSAVLCSPVHHSDAVLGRLSTVRARRGKKLATRVTVSVDERDYDQLSTLAEEHRVSLAWLVRYAVADFLERYRQDQLQLPLELTSRRQR
jgi:hypothetical protein